MARFDPSKQVLEGIDLGRFMHLEKVRELCVELVRGGGVELDYHDFTRDQRAISVL